MIHDYEACPSNVCETDPEKYLRIWYPDEELCQKKPPEKWQRIQRRIHKLFLKEKISNERYFTLEMLKRIKVVKKGIRGILIDKPKDFATAQKLVKLALKVP